MSQNYSQPESSRIGHRRPFSRELITHITATVREQHPLSTDLEAVVLSAVADQLPWLSTPDVLELRATIDVALDETAPLGDQVTTIVDAVLAEVEHWKRGASR